MMTWQQFDARLTNIEDQTQGRQSRVDGYYDQRMAGLFLGSDRSQEEIAEHLSEWWGKNVERRWVGYHLLFGRFLSFFGTSGSKDDAPAAQFKLPANLTERAFRRFWDATEAGGDFRGHKANTEAAVKDEQRRFGEVVKQLQEAGMSRKKKPVKRIIIKHLARLSSWLTAEEIRDKIASHFNDDLALEDVRNCLRFWTVSDKEPYRVEKVGEGDTAKYRIVKVKGQVVGRKQISQWSHDLVPMLDDLIREAHKDRVEISLTHLCDIASKIKKVMESMTANVPSKAECGE